MGADGRSFTLGAALRLAAAALITAGCATPGAPPPSPGDCVMIRVWSNGFHTNFALSADVLGNDHPLVGLFPEARYFLIGWGERDYYRAEDAGFWLGLKAVTPPSPSVIHVVASETPVEDSIWRPREIVDVALSGAGADRLAQSVADALAYDDAGAPIALGEGRVPGASLFLEARGDFHLLHMCNNWTASRLVEAGVPVEPGLAFGASSLMDALERKARRDCPD
jgi:hypothetical protein